MYDIELDELFERKSILEERRDSFFGDDEYPHHGDRNYQDILEKIDEVNEQINDIINKE